MLLSDGRVTRELLVLCHEIPLQQDSNLHRSAGVTQRKKPRLKKGRNIPPVASRTGVCFPEFLKALQARERVERADRRHYGLDEMPSFENVS